MAIKGQIAAGWQFGTQLMSAVFGNLAGFFCSAAAQNGRPLLTQIATNVDGLELNDWQPPTLLPALAKFLIQVLA